MSNREPIIIYTDGGCVGNPGPGGYGVVIQRGGAVEEIMGGFRLTTNNRMELLAAIVALEAVPPGSRVILHSDSQYLVNAMTQGWARRWRANGWRRNKTEKAINPDLWERLLKLAEARDVDFRWVRGHAGNAGNERADLLTRQAIKLLDLDIDEGYEGPRMKRPAQGSLFY